MLEEKNYHFSKQLSFYGASTHTPPPLQKNKKNKTQTTTTKPDIFRPQCVSHNEILLINHSDSDSDDSLIQSTPGSTIGWFQLHTTVEMVGIH